MKIINGTNIYWVLWSFLHSLQIEVLLMSVLIEDGPHCSLSTPLRCPQESPSWRYRVDRGRARNESTDKRAADRLTCPFMWVAIAFLLSSNHQTYWSALHWSRVTMTYSSGAIVGGKLARLFPVLSDQTHHGNVSYSPALWGHEENRQHLWLQLGSGHRSLLPLNSQTCLIVLHFSLSESIESGVGRAHRVIPRDASISRPSELLFVLLSSK